MNKNLFILLFLTIIFSNLIIAETETQPLNTAVDLKFTCTLNNAIPSGSTAYNITISSPNGSTFINNQATTPMGNGAFNYTTTFTEIGLYKVQMFCYDGTYSFSGEGFYDVTGNGKPAPNGSVIVLFSIIFLISVVLTGYMALYTIGHMLTLDFDILDLAMDWGIYFGIVAVYFLQNYYLGNEGIDKWLLLLVSVGGMFLILIPIIAFILSITIGSLQKKGIQNIQQPRRFRWRR